MRDGQGRTPLWLAVCQDENYDIIKVLLEAHADVSIRDAEQGTTPLQVIAIQQYALHHQ